MTNTSLGITISPATRKNTSLIPLPLQNEAESYHLTSEARLTCRMVSSPSEDVRQKVSSIHIGEGILRLTVTAACPCTIRIHREPVVFSLSDRVRDRRRLITASGPTVEVAKSMGAPPHYATCSASATPIVALHCRTLVTSVIWRDEQLTAVADGLRSYT